MNDLEMLRLRDGAEHRIGPLTLQRTGFSEAGTPTGTVRLQTGHRAGAVGFTLDWMDAEAIAFCIWPSARLWRCSESDRKGQRGWLRLGVTKDPRLIGHLPPAGWADRRFQVARLITNAGELERPEPRDGNRTTDYSRHRFILRPDARPVTATRTFFIYACTALGRSFMPNLPANWADLAKARWWAADNTFELAARLERGE